MKVRTNTPGERLLVRARPGTSGTIIGRLPHQTLLEVGETTVKGWVSVPLLVAGTPASIATGYLSEQFLERVDVPVPTGRRPLVGLNVLANHYAEAKRAAEDGCRYFMVMGDPGTAERLADEYPDAVVMARWWWGGQMPTPDRVLEVFSGCRHPRVVYTGLNEGDECGQGGHFGTLRIEELRKRSDFDIAVARRIRQNNPVGTYAAGTFSMGTPDFTAQAIRDAMREMYAPGYNSGLYSWDHHLYSPTMAFGAAPRTLVKQKETVIAEPKGRSGQIATYRQQQSVARGAPGWVDPIWFETRWRFLFNECGFNPASPSRVYCSETGMDEGGVGGFPAHGASEADVLRWARFFAAVSAEPVMVGEMAYPSPLVGGAIFQVGNTWDWAGYSVAGYMGALREVWKDERTTRDAAGAHGSPSRADG